MGERTVEIEDIVLVVPHRGERGDGPEKCIASAPNSLRAMEYVAPDGWLKTANNVIIALRLNSTRSAFLMGADDMIFHPGAVQIALDAMNERFPDGDGVVGFNQSNLVEHCEAGFTLIGPKFQERFEARGLFCPDYKHYYADTELLKYAKSVDKFYYCEDARVDHYHFSVTGEKDSTALESQKSRATDIETARKREEQGLLWGREFMRVNND